MSDLSALLDRARALLDPVRDTAETLGDLLRADGAIHAHPSPGTPVGPSGPVGFTDGAVASEQTDALAWVAAVGVTQTSNYPDREHSARTVVPVCGDVERVRSALMASCELRATTTALADHHPGLIFMDGGLATPLVSIGQGLLMRDPDATEAITTHNANTDLPDTIAAYVTAILSGHIAALPKQDTATGYVDQWARRYTGALTGAQRENLQRLRDRPVMGGLLGPGEWVTPRPAKELRNVEAKVSGPDGTAHPAAIDTDYGRLRDATHLHVTYFRPHRLASRVIKIEYAETDTDTWETARDLIRYLDTVTMGPRVKEPLGQHLVDANAKRAVTATMTEMMGHATTVLDPAATDRYRTVT